MSTAHQPASATIEALLIEAERGSLFDGVVKELRSLHHRNVVRLIDVIVVARRADGTIESHGSTELASEEVRELQSALTRTLGFRVGNQDFDPQVHWQGASVLLGVEDVKASALPALRRVSVSHQWCCFRPRHPDGRPVIDQVPGLSNAWLTSGHFRTVETLIGQVPLGHER